MSLECVYQNMDDRAFLLNRHINIYIYISIINPDFKGKKEIKMNKKKLKVQEKELKRLERDFVHNIWMIKRINL